MNAEVNEYFELLSGACTASGTRSIMSAYRRLRELVERLCRTQMERSTLQMTDLAARINFTSSKLGLSTGEQNRLHTFRLTSNEVLNQRAEPTREHLLRDVKTLAFLVKRIHGADIPDALYRQLPKADATYHTQAPARSHVKRMRVSFEEADEQFLYVLPADQLSYQPMRVRYNVPQVNQEFAATCCLLWRHARLNLLDVSIDEAGVLTPLFIILEPDYLIDISSLAECFKEYGHHPANYLLGRLQMPDNTRALLLGNIANLFLDEWIHAEGEPDYLECMQKAFRQYPIELATCPDLADRRQEADFFADCRRHFDNLRTTVTETFGMAGYKLDKRDAVLEPSYVCEALGLQGRLDYMQRDMTSFIEMKSGRADEYSLKGRIEPKENNRVQMQLYQAVLEYSMGMDHHHVSAYLLYTRYPLLYPARPSWAMVRRVMDVRNRIVATEYGIQLRCSTQYTAQCLAQINPATLNERQLDNTLWKRYLAPAISTLGHQLQALTPIEQSYFYTLYNFITKELYTAKSGDTDYDGPAGTASLWLSTLAEKQAAGEILHNLRITDNRTADPHHPSLHLALPEAEPADNADAAEEQTLPNFRAGDAVVLYERNDAASNVSNQLVFKANIEQISATTVSLRLRAAQRNSAVLPATSRYAIEHDSLMDTGFRSMYQGLATYLQANAERRALLLGQRPPRTDTRLDEAISHAASDFDRIALKADAASDYFLLVGPPGTGKTSRALRAMVERFHRDGKQLLLLSYTNRAVDEICKMLSAIRPAIDFIRIGGELNCEPAYHPRLIDKVLTPCQRRIQVKERLERCRVFVGTVSTLSSRTDLFRLKQFDVALIDEATQILEPQLLTLLCLRSATGTNAIGKFILIGDYKQLPAVVMQTEEQSAVADETLQAIGLINLKDSLFERLYRHLQSTDPALAHRCSDMLCRQGRMNEVVAHFPNEAFYGGHLLPVGLPHQAGVLPSPAGGVEAMPYAPLLTQRVSFIPSQPEPPEGGTKINHHEARIVAELAQSLYHYYQGNGGFNAGTTLGVITPYRSQIALIRREIARLGIEPLTRIVVDTVERFQGSERDVIIYSFSVNRLFQLKFLANTTYEGGTLIDRKLNVALTRARKQMFITGVPHLLATNPIYRRLMEMCSNGQIVYATDN